MALFPPVQGTLHKDARSRKGPETMSGYPTSDSIAARQPKASSNYPPPPPPKQAVRKHTAPSIGPLGGVEGKSTRQAASDEMDTDSELNGPTRFKYTRAPTFHADREGAAREQSRPPLRRRNSKAPIDMSAGPEGRGTNVGQGDNDDQDIGADSRQFATHTQRGPRAIPPPQDQNRQLARKRGTSVHRRLPHEDGPLSQGHDMVENQQGHPHRQPARSRATSVIRGGIDLNSTRVNPQANDIQDDDMGDPPQEGDTQQRPTRGRAPRPTHRGAGYEGPTRVNTPEEAQATSAPHRIRGVGQDDQRQSHSVPTNRRAVGEYEVTRRDEVVGNSIPLARGRSRIPDSQNPDVFTSVDHSPQRPGRGRLAASARTHDDDHHPRGNYQEDRAPSRPPPSTLHREARRPGHLGDPRVLLPLHTNGDPAAPPSRNEFGTTQQRSKSVQPSGGLHDVLLNQIVSSVSEEIAVLRERVANYKERCDGINKLEATIETYKSNFSEERHRELEKQYNDVVAEAQGKVARCVQQMKFLSQSSAVAMDATESRMDTVRNLNAAFESQNIMLMSEVKGVKNLVEEKQRQLDKAQEAIETARKYTMLYNKLDQELMDSKSEVEKLQGEMKETIAEKDQAVAAKDEVEAASKKEAEACWAALAGKMSDEKIDSLKFNKAPPLAEVITILDDAYAKHTEDNKTLTATQNTLATTQTDLATTRADLKAQKAAYNGGCDAIGSLCKVLNVDPPARSTPGFLEAALMAVKPALTDKLKTLTELASRLGKVANENTELSKQLAEAQSSLTLARAERDDLKENSDKTKEELNASAERAKSLTALQKELREYQEKEKTLKQSLTQIRESEQALKTQLMTVKGQAAEDAKANEAAVKAAEKAHAEKVEQDAMKLQALVNEIANIKEVAKEKAKLNGVGVSAAAANKDESERVKRELEAEKAKHDQAKVLERWSAGKPTSAEKALIEHVQGELVDPSSEAQKLADEKWEEKFGKSENEAKKHKKNATILQKRCESLEAKLALQEQPKGQSVKRGANSQISRSKSVAPSAPPQDPESPVKATAETLSYFDGNSDLEDQEILKKHTTITSASTSSATGNSKKKGGRTDQARVETEFIKASEHSDIARSDKSRKRALTEAATESMTSSPKKTRFANLPSSEATPLNDELSDGLSSPPAEGDDSVEVERSKQIEDPESDDDMAEETLVDKPATQSKKAVPVRAKKGSRMTRTD